MIYLQAKHVVYEGVIDYNLKIKKVSLYSN